MNSVLNKTIDIVGPCTRINHHKFTITISLLILNSIVIFVPQLLSTIYEPSVYFRLISTLGDNSL